MFILWHGIVAAYPTKYAAASITRKLFFWLAFVGAILPDVVAHINWLWNWGSWEWYHYAHNPVNAGLVCFMLGVIILGLWSETWGRYTYVPPSQAILGLTVMPFGAMSHLGIDWLYHQPGGGWYPWAPYVDWTVAVLIVIIFLKERYYGKDTAH